jgi:hypothetical protein
MPAHIRTYLEQAGHTHACTLPCWNEHKTYISNITDNTYTYISIILVWTIFCIRTIVYIIFFTVMLGRVTDDDHRSRRRGTDKQGRGVVMPPEEPYTEECTQFARCGSGLWILAGVYVRGGHLADTALQRRCDLRELQQGRLLSGRWRGPGTSSWDSKLPRRRRPVRLGSPRLTWARLCEQVLPRRRYIEDGPHKGPPDSSCGWSLLSVHIL